MSGSALYKLAFSLFAAGLTLQCLPASAESNQRNFTDLDTHSLYSSHSKGIWHESPLASQVIDKLLIRNWTSLNNKNGIDWSNQISNLALNLASKKLSNYATNAIQKFPFVWAPWCVGTLKVFKAPLCTSCGAWALWTFFNNSLCVDPVLCEDFENISKISLCVGPVVCGDFEFF